MNTFSFGRIARAGSVAMALTALGTGAALAQGTAAERDACTPDALRLCSDTIPDIPKTTACMKAHASQLSARCRPFVVARAEPERRSRPPAVTRRIEREASPPDYSERPPAREYEERDYGYRGRDDRGYGDRGYGEPGYGEPAYGERRYLYRAPDGEEAEAPDYGERAYGDRARARAEIGRLCDDDMIDPRTCALTERALH